MVVERFNAGCFEKVYERFDEYGRMLLDGLYYLNSLLNKEKNICFQLMETDDERLFTDWIEKWKDLTDIEIFPID